MVQIDVMRFLSNAPFIECNLYANDRCVKMYITVSTYECLVKDGFFIRDGKEYDSANVLNTTEQYKLNEK